MKNFIILSIAVLFFYSCSNTATLRPSLNEEVDVASVITGPDYSDTFNVKIRKNSYKYQEAVQARRLAAAKVRQETQDNGSEDDGMIRLRKKTNLD